MSVTRPALDFQIPYEAKQAPVFYYTRTTFEPYVGGIFTARARRRNVNLTLQSIRDCTPNPKSRITTKSRTSDCFALVFRASAPLTELTTIQQIEHGALGKFDLFLTRRDDERGVIFYEAVINHAR